MFKFASAWLEVPVLWHGEVDVIIGESSAHAAAEFILIYSPLLIPLGEIQFFSLCCYYFTHRSEIHTCTNRTYTYALMYGEMSE